jgi:hypothetical protein
MTGVGKEQGDHSSGDGGKGLKAQILNHLPNFLK